MKNIKYIVSGVLALIIGFLVVTIVNKPKESPVLQEVEIVPVAQATPEPEPVQPTQPVAKPVTKPVVKVAPKVAPVVAPTPVVVKPTTTVSSVPDTSARDKAKADLDWHVSEWNAQIQVYKDRVTAITAELKQMGIALDKENADYNAIQNPTDAQRQAHTDYLNNYTKKTNELGNERNTYAPKIADLQQYIDLAIADYEQKWGK